MLGIVETIHAAVVARTGMYNGIQNHYSGSRSLTGWLTPAKTKVELWFKRSGGTDWLKVRLG